MSGKPKLLVVDDQPNNIHAIKRIVDSNDVEVIEALSGDAALMAVLKYDFFLILMDVQMPGMNGFEAAELILNNKKTAHIPIIFLTAISKSDDFVMQGYGAGAVDYIYKPVDSHILLGKIKIFRELWSSKQELVEKNIVLEKQERVLKEQKQALEKASLRINMLLSSAGEGILGIDYRGEIMLANPKACELLAEPAEALQGKNIRDFFLRTEESSGAQDQADKTTRFSDLFHEKHAGQYNTSRWRRSNETSFYVEYSCNEIVEDNDISTGAVIMFQDITQRRELEESLKFMANFDSLTGIANRNLFHVSLHKSMERQKRTNSILAVLFIDLDDFKIVNDTWGHEAGDQLLVQVSERIIASTREGDVVARLGGDEFAIIMHDIAAPENADMMAEKIITELGKPFNLACTVANIGGSVGVADHCDTGISKDELIKRADTAMYKAKEAGKNSWRRG